MLRQFHHLTRPAIRALKPGEQITEDGITAAKLDDGYVRVSINIMVHGQRIHRTIGLKSNGITRSQAEEFVAKTRSEATAGRLELPKGRKLKLTFCAAADIYLERLEEIDGKDYTKNE